MLPLINCIGAGNLGKTIIHLLVNQGLVQMGSVCNRSQTSARQAIQFIGGGDIGSSIHELPAASITFITTPDDVISQVAEELSHNPQLLSGSIVLHCSGSLGSNILLPLQNKGCYIASIHPMRSFAKPDLSIKQFTGTFCAMEGDVEALSVLGLLFTAIGAQLFRVDKNKKALYHAAGVFASNYLITLAQQALSCMQEAGVEQEISMKMITGIMRNTLANLEHTRSPEQSLTGPLQRGDVATIGHHMQALKSESQRALYALLGKATLPLTTLPSEKILQLETSLEY